MSEPEAGIPTNTLSSIEPPMLEETEVLNRNAIAKGTEDYSFTAIDPKHILKEVENSVGNKDGANIKLVEVELSASNKDVENVAPTAPEDTIISKGTPETLPIADVTHTHTILAEDKETKIEEHTTPEHTLEKTVPTVDVAETPDEGMAQEAVETTDVSPQATEPLFATAVIPSPVPESAGVADDTTEIFPPHASNGVSAVADDISDESEPMPVPSVTDYIAAGASLPIEVHESSTTSTEQVEIDVSHNSLSIDASVSLEDVSTSIGESSTPQISEAAVAELAETSAVEASLTEVPEHTPSVLEEPLQHTFVPEAIEPVLDIELEAVPAEELSVPEHAEDATVVDVPVTVESAPQEITESVVLPEIETLADVVVGAIFVEHQLDEVSTRLDVTCETKSGQTVNEPVVDDARCASESEVDAIAEARTEADITTEAPSDEAVEAVAELLATVEAAQLVAIPEQVPAPTKDDLPVDVNEDPSAMAEDVPIGEAELVDATEDSTVTVVPKVEEISMLEEESAVTHVVANADFGTPSGDASEVQDDTDVHGVLESEVVEVQAAVEEKQEIPQEETVGDGHERSIAEEPVVIEELMEGEVVVRIQDAAAQDGTVEDTWTTDVEDAEAVVEESIQEEVSADVPDLPTESKDEAIYVNEVTEVATMDNVETTAAKEVEGIDAVPIMEEIVDHELVAPAVCSEAEIVPEEAMDSNPEIVLGETSSGITWSEIEVAKAEVDEDIAVVESANLVDELPIVGETTQVEISTGSHTVDTEGIDEAVPVEDSLSSAMVLVDIQASSEEPAAVELEIESFPEDMVTSEPEAVLSKEAIELVPAEIPVDTIVTEELSQEEPSVTGVVVINDPSESDQSVIEESDAKIVEPEMEPELSEVVTIVPAIAPVEANASEIGEYEAAINGPAVDGSSQVTDKTIIELGAAPSDEVVVIPEQPLGDASPLSEDLEVSVEAVEPDSIGVAAERVVVEVATEPVPEINSEVPLETAEDAPLRECHETVVEDAVSTVPVDIQDSTMPEEVPSIDAVKTVSDIEAEVPPVVAVIDAANILMDEPASEPEISDTVEETVHATVEDVSVAASGHLADEIPASTAGEDVVSTPLEVVDIVESTGESAEDDIVGLPDALLIDSARESESLLNLPNTETEAPRSPWTPSYSVTTQGPGLVVEDDIPELNQMAEMSIESSAEVEITPGLASTDSVTEIVHAAEDIVSVPSVVPNCLDESETVASFTASSFQELAVESNAVNSSSWTPSYSVSTQGSPNPVDVKGIMDSEDIPTLNQETMVENEDLHVAPVLQALDSELVDEEIHETTLEEHTVHAVGKTIEAVSESNEEVTNLLPADSSEIIRPSSPWTPSYSVSVQGSPLPKEVSQPDEDFPAAVLDKAVIVESTPEDAVPIVSPISQPSSDIVSAVVEPTKAQDVILELEGEEKVKSQPPITVAAVKAFSSEDAAGDNSLSTSANLLPTESLEDTQVVKEEIPVRSPSPWTPSYAVTMQGSTSSVVISAELEAHMIDTTVVPDVPEGAETVQDEVKQSVSGDGLIAEQTSSPNVIPVSSDNVEAARPASPWSPSYAVNQQGSSTVPTLVETDVPIVPVDIASVEPSIVKESSQNKVIGTPVIEVNSIELVDTEKEPISDVNQPSSAIPKNEEISETLPVDATAPVEVEESQRTPPSWTPSYSVSRQGSRPPSIAPDTSEEHDVKRAEAEINESVTSDTQVFPSNGDIFATLDTDVDNTDGQVRTRLESTASSRFFPDGYRAKLPEGRTSLDIASGEFISPKSPSEIQTRTGIATDIPKITVEEEIDGITNPEEEDEQESTSSDASSTTDSEGPRKGRWCVVM